MEKAVKKEYKFSGLKKNYEFVPEKNAVLRNTETESSPDCTDCFIARVCAAHKGYSKDREYNEAFRCFCDLYISRQYKGNELIGEYSRISCAIISEIDKDPSGEIVYERIYLMFDRIYMMIRSNRMHDAAITGRQMIHELKLRYAC